MSKTESLLLVLFVSFNALLFATLLTRAIVGIARARWAGAPKLRQVRESVAAPTLNRAWTRAVWRERLIEEAKLGEPASVTGAANAPYSKALC